MEITRIGRTIITIASFFCFFLKAATAGAQTAARDSIARIVQSDAPDTVRIRAALLLSRQNLDLSITHALHYGKQALHLSTARQWLPGQVLSEIAIGDCFSALRQNNRALDHYNSALTYARRQADSFYVIRSLYAISEIYAHTNERDSELHYKLRGLALSRAVADTQMQVRILQKMGYYYEYEGNYEAAIAYWKQCLAIVPFSTYRPYEPMIWGNLGQSYDHSGKYDSARRAYFSGLAAVDQQTNKDAVMFLELCLANFYKARNNADSGIRMAQQVLQLAQREQSIGRLNDAYRILYELYEATGNTKKALDHYKQHIIFRDSLAHEARDADDAKKILKLEYEHQLTTITRQRNTVVATSRQRLYIMTSLGLGLGLVAILAAFLYKSLKQNRWKATTIAAQADTLRKQKTAIQESLNEKEILIQEIHHRVKNNLQVITSLLQLQSARSKDAEVKAALNESQNRVLSIAFIHHNLYQQEDLKGVEMRSFIDELTGHIAEVFRHPNKDISVVNNIGAISLDIDTAVPLGLIINELLTNSFKYAFNDKTTGLIRISLGTDDQLSGHYVLEYADDGPGLPETLDWKRARSLGLRLITRLSKQLRGTLTYANKPASVFRLLFYNFDDRNQV